tara:strand:- start:21 stop:842 length:822 start_codon:yes stop_codon:yes gene_type:complete
MNLLDYKADIYSATGNDGIIEKIFEILKIEEGLFVEFGAWDGIHGSNCRRLWEKGWSGIFIEPDTQKYGNLIKNYGDQKKIHCLKSFVDNKNNLFDDVVRPHIKGTIDFCSIDIDGLDLEVFEKFKDFLPTVVCIEGGQMVEVHHERLPPHIAKRNIQQSLKVITEAFEEKGYRLLCSYQDSFFVKEEFFDLFNIVPKELIQYYLEGLAAIPRRMPWIQLTLSQAGLKNRIIDFILAKTKYYHYGYEKRKVWAVEEIDLILEVIEELKRKSKE